MRRGILLLVLLLFLVGCGGTATPEAVNLPEGDVARGADLFNAGVSGSPTCVSCHMIPEETRLGPCLLGFGAIAGTRVEGQTDEEYAYQSIIRPADHVVDGFGNLMYTEYQTKLSEQEISDLIAYLLSQ